jgi:DNA-binding MarR family transcriptional regulator
VNQAITRNSQVDVETRASDAHHQALRLWLRLLACTGMIESEIRSRLRAEFGTTLPRFDLMSRLERYPQGLKMKELSHHLMVTGGNVTGIVDPLEKEGLVERLPEPGDRRAFRVRLTRSGDKAFAEMARAHEDWIISIFSGLTRKEHAELFRLLAKVKSLALPTAERKDAG